MSADAWIAVIGAAVGLLAVWFYGQERDRQRPRTMRRCAIDAELSRVKHGRW